MCPGPRAQLRTRPGRRKAFSRRDAPEICKLVSPAEGVGNAGRSVHPQPVCIGSKHTVVTTGTPETPGIPARNGFNGFLRARPGDEFLFVTVVPQIDGVAEPVGPNNPSAGLSISNGCQAHTTSPYAASSANPRQAVCDRPSFDGSVEAPIVLHAVDRSRGSSRPATSGAPSAAASTASRPNVRDDGQRPSFGTEQRECEVDLGSSAIPSGCDRLTRRAICAWRPCANCASRA